MVLNLDQLESHRGCSPTLIVSYIPILVAETSSFSLFPLASSHKILLIFQLFFCRKNINWVLRFHQFWTIPKFPHVSHFFLGRKWPWRPALQGLCKAQAAHAAWKDQALHPGAAANDTEKVIKSIGNHHQTWSFYWKIIIELDSGCFFFHLFRLAEFWKNVSPDMSGFFFWWRKMVYLARDLLYVPNIGSVKTGNIIGWLTNGVNRGRTQVWVQWIANGCHWDLAGFRRSIPVGFLLMWNGK